MHFFALCQTFTMNFRNNWQKLQRKEFSSLMTDANMDYLLDRKEKPFKYPKGDEFNPLNTPNRNPKQVSAQLWVSLLALHLNSHSYN